MIGDATGNVEGNSAAEGGGGGGAEGASAAGNTVDCIQWVSNVITSCFKNLVSFDVNIGKKTSFSNATDISMLFRIVH